MEYLKEYDFLYTRALTAEHRVQRLTDALSLLYEATKHLPSDQQYGEALRFAKLVLDNGKKE